MLKRFRSFRFKLIFYFVAVFGMIQIMLSLAGLAIRERSVRELYDDQVLERVSMIEEHLQASPGPVTSELLSAIVVRLPRGPSFREYFAQARDLDGATLARTTNLEGNDLPFTQAIRDELAAKGIDARMVSNEVVRPTLPEGSYRLISQRKGGIKGQAIVLQIATSFEPVERSISSLRWLFYVGLPLGLGAAAVTSWLVTGRLSDRINRVSALARELTLDDLSRRLAEPTADDEVTDLVRQINRMLDRVEAGFRAQERFIHDASHELKTPIAALLTEAQVVKMTCNNPDEYRRFLNSTINELMHMSRLIESLLLLTRMDKDRPPDNYEDCDVNDLVVDAVRRCRPLAEEYGVELLITALDAVDGCEPRTVYCNAELIMIMISNLVRNGIRFTPAEGKVRVETRGMADGVTIAVTDEGPGIVREDLARVFDRFYQGRQTAARRGTGLGLAIAQTIARMHRGSIDVGSINGRGAVFTIFLPFRPSHEASTASPALTV